MIEERALGKEHPDLAIRCNNFAGVYYAQKQVSSCENPPCCLTVRGRLMEVSKSTPNLKIT